MNEEFVFNIWFIVDIGTNLSKYCYIRPYCLIGSDEEKIKVLNSLAETDYKSCDRVHFAEYIDTVYGEGQVAKGYLYLSSINSHFDSENEYFIKQAEKQLPLLIKFEGDGIEYSLSIVVEDDRVLINYSTWDRTTRIGIYDKKYIDSIINYY